MFQFEIEKEKYGLKPMNCPGHWYVFNLISKGELIVLASWCLSVIVVLALHHFQRSSPKLCG